jgi:hypothetical protein
MRSRRHSRTSKLKVSSAKRPSKAIAAQLKILKLFGTIEFDLTNDYKAERKRNQIR